MSIESPRLVQRGISLIELVVFIIVISVALTGILVVMNTVAKGSADPMLRKQALAIAESLLEEVELMPLTYCDPDDPSAVAATSVADCTGGAGGANDESAAMGPEGATSVGGAEGRYAAPQFDNVSDYHGLSLSGAGGIRDITNSVISAALDGYSASVTVAATDFGGITQASGDALLITVTVTDPAGQDIVVQGVRTRYAPRAVP